METAFIKKREGCEFVKGNKERAVQQADKLLDEKEIESENVFCARYGGDEFTIVYSNMTAQEIRNVVEAIRSKVKALNIPHKSSVCDTQVTVSQGIFVKVPDEENREWGFTE